MSGFPFSAGCAMSGRKSKKPPVPEDAVAVHAGACEVVEVDCFSTVAAAAAAAAATKTVLKMPCRIVKLCQFGRGVEAGRLDGPALKAQ